MMNIKNHSFFNKLYTYVEIFLGDGYEKQERGIQCIFGD